MSHGSTMEDRLWNRVDKTDGCWEWTGPVSSSGYGQIALPRASGRIYVHRYSAMLHFGMFDRRLLVLHHCDNKRCVRPDHLYLGDHGDNLRDRHARMPWAHWCGAKTHCKSGHAFDEPNTRINAKTGQRHCRACARERARRA